MKTKHSLFVTSDSCTNAAPTSGKTRLRNMIRLALVGSVLISGTASAILKDHGPSDPTLTWPLWYRDTQGLALGMCTSTTTFCFPLTPDAAGFPGNVGPELFYNMVEFKAAAGTPTATGSDFEYRYMGALEASYIPGPTPFHGTEAVFARIRITFNFNDVNKNGTYVVTHPFGVHTFPDVQATTKTNLIGAQAANFFTVDVPLGVPMDFDSAMTGPIGPFIKWDTGLPLISGTEEFVGDPTVPHTFTGSPFGTNFLRIQGPPNSNLDGKGNDFIQVNLGNVLGQKWTAPIAEPLKVDAATYTRSAAAGNGVDVWATSTPNQTLVATGTGIAAPGIALKPDGVTPGKYHGRVEYASSTPPADITVTNSTSNPIATATAPVIDVVEVAQATFNTATRVFTVEAHSDDTVTNPALDVQGVPGIPTALGVVPALTGAMTAAQCTAAGITTLANAADVCFTYTLPANIEPPEKVTVTSAANGRHADELVQLVGGPQNPLTPPVATDIPAPGFIVTSSGVTNLVPNLPLDALVIQQPANGIVSLNAGQWIFTANAGIAAGGITDSFKFVTQVATPNNSPVSNLATAALSIGFTTTAPTVVADQYAARTAVARVLNVLANDKAASANALDQIAPATIAIVTAPTKGTATPLADGTIRYTATTGSAAGTVDTFTYTVKNVGTNVSTPATVTMTNFTAAEQVSFKRADYDSRRNVWAVVGATTWFGPSLTNVTGTCWIGTAISPTVATTIGSATVDPTGAFQIIPLGTAPVITAAGPIRCQTSSGGVAAGTIVFK
jgi:hypothetical protein